MEIQRIIHNNSNGGRLFIVKIAELFEECEQRKYSHLSIHMIQYSTKADLGLKTI